VDPLRPSHELFQKLAAIVMRADTYISPGGGMLDLALLEQSLLDPEVQEWMEQIKSRLPADPPLFWR
jgi:hypothetical protein